MQGRCKSYRRSSGVFTYSGVRCALRAGHSGHHVAYGRWLDPTRTHVWGRPVPMVP